MMTLGTKKPAQHKLWRVSLALAAFLMRPQADIKSAQIKYRQITVWLSSIRMM
ncbi:MAG: hypothetical protein AB2693_17490 [Candidatus Thiodiazotropha sp.]